MNSSYAQKSKGGVILIYNKTKDQTENIEEVDYYKGLLIKLIETLNEKQRGNLYYIALGMKKE